MATQNKKGQQVSILLPFGVVLTVLLHDFYIASGSPEVAVGISEFIKKPDQRLGVVKLIFADCTGSGCSFALHAVGRIFYLFSAGQT
jgi:hypothetical protein